jgi:tetratricopeptide (TPR) repeat protein
MMRRAWMPLALVGLSLGLYARTWGYGFTNWDDQLYILQNPFLSRFSLDNITQIIHGEMRVNELLFIPLTYLSYLLDGALTGMDPARFHLTNTLLHAANTLLVFFLLRHCRISARGAFVGTLIFALHPMQVESVAWIMARKDLLSTFLACLAMLLYLRSARSHFWWLWCGSLLLFGLAVFAKPTVIVLPALLIGVDYLAGSLKRSRLFASIPFWAVSVLGWGLNESGIGGTRGVEFLGTVIGDITRRIALIDPVNTYYSVRVTALADPTAVPTCAALAAILLLVLVCLWFRRWRPLAVIVMAGIALLPAISVALSLGRDFISADRYAYLPLLFVGMLIGLGTEEVVRHKRWPLLALVAWCGYATAQSWQQVPVWSSSELLWRQALEYDSENAIACNSLGNYYAAAGDPETAAEWYQEAVRLNPHNSLAQFNLGQLELAANRAAAAVAHFEAALKINPAFRNARYQLAVAHIQRADWQPATRAVRAILEHPDNARDGDAWYLYGKIYYLQDEFDTAFDAFQNCISVNDGHAPAYFRVGMIQQKRGALSSALAAFQRVVEVNPAHSAAHFNAAIILQQQQQLLPALDHLQKASALTLDDPEIRRQLEALEKHLAAPPQPSE